MSGLLRRGGSDERREADFSRISRDAPEAIDDRAFREAWTRYSRGDRRSFSAAPST